MPKHDWSHVKWTREYSARPPCPCGLRWEKHYCNGVLVEIRCGRGHRPIDVLQKTLVKENRATSRKEVCAELDSCDKTTIPSDRADTLPT